MTSETIQSRTSYSLGFHICIKLEDVGPHLSDGCGLHSGISSSVACEAISKTMLSLSQSLVQNVHKDPTNIYV